MPKQEVYRRHTGIECALKVFQDGSDSKNACQTCAEKHKLKASGELSDQQSNKGTLVPSTKGAGATRTSLQEKQQDLEFLLQVKLLVVVMQNKLFNMKPLPTVSFPSGM